MKVRFFAMTISRMNHDIIEFENISVLLMTPDRHWNKSDVFESAGLVISKVIWEKELNYEDALAFSKMNRDDFDNLIIKTTTENRSFHHDA